MNFRAGDGKGGWITLNLFDVFETPDIEVEVPEEWMKKVHSHADYAKHSKYMQQPKHHEDPRDMVRYYDRYVPPERRGRSRQPLFGPAGSPNQDEYVYPIERWQEDIGWDTEIEEDLVQYLHHGDLGLAIESLIESAEILNDDEAKTMWISLIEQLDPQAKEVLRRVVNEA
jgi:hypothetical protein